MTFLTTIKIAAIVAALVAISLLFPGCDPRACALFEKTHGFIAAVVRPVLDLALPILAPGAAEQYGVLSHAADAGADLVLGSCAAGGKPKPTDLAAATDAALALLEFYRVHKPGDPAATARVIQERRMPVARDFGVFDPTRDPVVTLLAARGKVPAEAKTDLEALYQDLAEMRAKTGGPRARDAEER